MKFCEQGLGHGLYCIGEKAMTKMKLYEFLLKLEFACGENQILSEEIENLFDQCHALVDSGANANQTAPLVFKIVDALTERLLGGD